MLRLAVERPGLSARAMEMFWIRRQQLEKTFNDNAIAIR